ncbi:hypothetical protein L6452_05075 [Arctium lappa]|uniref:Uncharacterized protein n=1 Tax=Arctium lappa TaxID=4217 RepID=A0ACB9EFU1_ARCLA|nr:hypothetical protein L6452_05075 [Arctium lappa]
MDRIKQKKLATRNEKELRDEIRKNDGIEESPEDRQSLINFRQNSAISNLHSSQQLAQFLIVPHSKLNVPRCDPGRRRISKKGLVTKHHPLYKWLPFPLVFDSET